MRGLVVIAVLTACSDGSAQTDVSTARPAVSRTTAAPETTAPPTTTTSTPTSTSERITTPPTTLPAATSTTSTTTSTPAPPPPDATPAIADPATWPPYEPLPGVAGVAALTNAARPELENVAALAVKIDNHPRARPQWSLSMADVIFEENVEFLTRFIAIFHSRLPDVIGPIRSARTSDMNILAAFNRPVLAWSGGNKNVTAVVRSAAQSGILVNISAQQIGRCYRRASGRKAPHNLVVNPGCALDSAPTAGPARPPWSFDDAFVPQGEADTAFEVRMDGVGIVWVWDAASGHYLRNQSGQPHLATDGTQISATNVLVMSVAYIPSPADERSPEAQTLGSGQVVVHRNGVAAIGTWSRAAATDPFVFTDGVGTPIPLAAGTTFVELVRA